MADKPDNVHGLLVLREDLGIDTYTLVAPGEPVPADLAGLPVIQRDPAPEEPRTDLAGPT